MGKKHLNHKLHSLVHSHKKVKVKKTLKKKHLKSMSKSAISRLHSLAFHTANKIAKADEALSKAQKQKAEDQLHFWASAETTMLKAASQIHKQREAEALD